MLVSQGTPDDQYAHVNHLEPTIKTSLGFVSFKVLSSIAVEHQSDGGQLIHVPLEHVLSATTSLVENLLSTG